MLKTCSFILIMTVFASAPLSAQTMQQKQQRTASQKQVEIRLNEVREKLRGLRINTATLDEGARNEFKRLTAELNMKQALAGKKIGEMKAADAREWDRYRAEANAAVDELNRVYSSMQSLKK